jgi:hypothetical protein
VEVFFAFDGSTFKVASSVPRFAKRSKGLGKVCGIDLFLVDSKAPTGTIPRTRENLADGFWCVESDWIPKGGYAFGHPGAPAHMTTLFGFPVVAPCDFETFARILYFVQTTLKQELRQPIVVYHGTSRDHVKSIVKGGLKASFGMFGTAVYLGTFWKAFRFATLTQDYKPREGAVFRILAFWNTTFFRHATSPACFCSMCCGKPTFADHQEQWKTSAADNIVLLPVEQNGKFIVKNEEYACRDSSLLFLDTVCNATRSGSTHNPWDRSMIVD